MGRLDMNDLLSDPASSLARVSVHFGHQPETSEIKQMIHPDVLGVHAKDTRVHYDPGLKQREREQVLSVHGREIKTAVAWASQLSEALDLWPFLRELQV